jgi:hypothetical protein
MRSTRRPIGGGFDEPAGGVPQMSVPTYRNPSVATRSGKSRSWVASPKSPATKSKDVHAVVGSLRTSRGCAVAIRNAPSPDAGLLCCMNHTKRSASGT